MVDNTREGEMPRDKHWSALVNHTKLYFTYNLDPLRVIDCGISQSSANCRFVHKEGGCKDINIPPGLHIAHLHTDSLIAIRWIKSSKPLMTELLSRHRRSSAVI